MAKIPFLVFEALLREVAWVYGCEAMPCVPAAMAPVPGRAYADLPKPNFGMHMHGHVWTRSTQEDFALAGWQPMQQQFYRAAVVQEEERCPNSADQ